VALGVASYIDVTECGAIVQQELGEMSRAIILSNLTELVEGLEIIRNDLQEIHITTKSLQESSSSLAHSKLLHWCKSVLVPAWWTSDTQWLMRWHGEEIIPFSSSTSPN
jgi:hypothetical protein